MQKDLKRRAIHEAGHFAVAYRYNPRRAVSICVGDRPAVDTETGTPYHSTGQTVTWDLDGGQPHVLLPIRAGGIAAESLIYEEPYEQLMSDPQVLWTIKTDLDNAKQDLYRNGLIFRMTLRSLSFGAQALPMLYAYYEMRKISCTP